MAKISRKELATYIDGTPSTTASYALLGADLEELSVEMNMEVEAKTNIIGGASIQVTNGTRTASVEPYYADAGTDLHTFLQDILDNQKELDDLKTTIVEVKKWESPTGDAYPAIRKEVIVEITSYGGDDSGYTIPFNLHFTGTQTAGTYDIVTDTFTAS